MEYIAREKQKKHTQVVNELESVLFSNGSLFSHTEKRFKNTIPIPRDAEKGFPLLEIHNFDIDIESVMLAQDSKSQLLQVINEFKQSDILATYNLQHKKKILLCGKPGTGKTFSVRAVSSKLNIPMVYVRFDAIVSSYLGETASNLRKVFDFIESSTWIVLFDEFDIIGKNRDDHYEHGEIKRVVNNFLQMLDSYNGDSIIFAATNHQNILDPAIWRRFDDVIKFELPGPQTRKILFEQYLKYIPKDKNINLIDAANMSDGLSPSDIKMIAENTVKMSILNNLDSISQEQLIESINMFKKREAIKRIQ